MPIARRLESGTGEPMKSIGTGGGKPGKTRKTDSPSSSKDERSVLGKPSDADFKGYITMLIGKMVDDPTLQEQAQANDTVDAIC
jgi:type I restriction enzyme R subunit